MSNVSEIYEILDALLSLEDMEEEEKNTQVFMDTFEALDGELDIRLENIGKWRANLKAKSLGLKAEEDRLASKRKSIDKTIEWIEKNIEQIMRASGKMKVETPLFKFAIQKNGGKASLKLKEGLTTDDVSPEYIKFLPPVFDNDAIREALDNGENLEWAELVRGESLRIK